ncbi:MAG: hypothetical protein GC202_11095 [Alphaproteobacteria bacterium]|nr:hypothetical protein [Alphaproteobacteria bacterium]
MNGCRAKAISGALALLAAAYAGPGLAQTTPTLLLPPSREARPAAPQTEPERPAASTPALPGPAGIEIENAQPLDTEGLGLIDAANGGLSADTWAASNRTFVERIVRELPAPIASMPARALALRVLETTAAAPSGPKGANFAALRALKLRQLGEIALASNLASLIPQRNGDENLLRVLIDEAWLADDDERACNLVRDALGVSKSPDFQKALMFCQALSGDQTRVQLGLAMLRDQGVPEDAAFVTLLFAVGGDGKGVKIDGLRDATPLTIAMLRAAKVAPPPDVAATNDPAVLANLAAGDDGTPEFRLAAAERAEAFGAIDPQMLATLYADFELTPAQVADAANFARKDGGPKGRAALFKAAQAASAPAERLAALQRLWQFGRERGGYATLARVGVTLLSDVPAGPDYVAYSADVARALLMAGHEDEALGWMRFARAAQAAGDEKAEAVTAGFWMLASLGGLNWDGARDPGRLEAWRKSIEASAPQTAPARAALATTLLAGLGMLPPGGTIVATTQAPFERLSVPMPSPVLWTSLHEAAVAGRPAEAALLAVHLLGVEGAAGASPYTMLAVLDGLRAVGFEQAARRLALESAIASGL